MDKGSLRGSIFALAASSLGSGVLAMPYVLTEVGWLLGILLIINGAVAAIWSLIMIAKTAIKTEAKNLSELALKTGGVKLERFL